MVAPSSKSSSKGRSFFRHLLASTFRRRAALLLAVAILVSLLGTFNTNDPYGYSLEASNSTLLQELLQSEIDVVDTSQQSTTSHGATPPFSAVPLDTTGNKAQPSPRASRPAQAEEAADSKTSIILFDEADLSTQYSTQKKFSATYFRSSPPCVPLSADQVSFTLTTQASLDRLWIMRFQCERWPPPLPISIAVYLPPNSTHDGSYVENELGANLGCGMERMTVTVLKGTSSMEKYPVNLLRNLAIQAAKTTHVLYIDSDFLISDGIHENLQIMAPVVANDSKAAVVIPAFNYFSKCLKFSSEDQESLDCLAEEWSSNPTKTKKNMLKLWKRNKGNRPNAKPGFHGIHFHSTTLYAEWKNQTGPLRIPCLKNYLYEPYLAVRLCNKLVEFPPLFRGYGWNKNIWIQWLLFKQGYRLWQVPNGFVFHMPHSKSAGWKVQRNETEKKTDPDYVRYMNWMKNEVPTHPDTIPGCPGFRVGGNRRKRKRAKQSNGR